MHGEVLARIKLLLYTLVIPRLGLFNLKCCCAVWTRIVAMEGLEEYAKEGSPLNEQSNSIKEPVKEEITNNSSELLQTIKDLKT